MNAVHEMARIRVLKAEIAILERKQRRLALHPDLITLLEQVTGKRDRRVRELNDRVANLRKFRNARAAQREEKARARARLQRDRRRGTLATIHPQRERAGQPHYQPGRGSDQAAPSIETITAR